MAAKVWVLTSEYDNYDQYGEHFEAVWSSKPTVKQLTEYFSGSKEGLYFYDPMTALDFILHVQNGGGRREHEDMWYNLGEVEFE